MTTDSSRLLRLLRVVVAAAWLSGCFSSGDGTGPDLDDCLRSSAVGMTNDLKFDAPCVRVRAGETVRWTNSSAVAHTVTADPAKAANPANVTLPPGAAAFDSGNMPSGATFEHTFSVAGRYDYVCLPHEGAGMIGTVIVDE